MPLLEPKLQSWTGFFLAMLTVLGLTACSPKNACHDPLGCVELTPGQSLTVGVAVPLTGPDRADGEAALKAVQEAAGRKKTIRGHGIHIQKTDLNCIDEDSRTVSERLTGDESLTGVITASCLLHLPESQQVYQQAGIPVIAQGDPAAAPIPIPGILSLDPAGKPVNENIDPSFAVSAFDIFMDGVSAVSIQQVDGSLVVPRQALENRLQLAAGNQ